MAGEKFELKNDDNILDINSPKANLKGPYLVVYKHMVERWAIVALDWDDAPRLGVRWFWGSKGNPISTGYPTWFIVPESLSRNMLLGLPIDHKVSMKIDEFLAGKINGEELIKVKN